MVFTDPQAASVGEPDGPLTATVPLAEVPRTSTYTRAYAETPRLHDARLRRRAAHRAPTRSAPRPASGSSRPPWRFVRACRSSVLFDVIQPFPSFSEAFLATLTDLEAQI